jgi:hypothetical protein
MNPFEYIGNDPAIFDRAILHYLAASKRICNINSFRVLLILLAKCEWSFTYFGDSKPPIARITNNGQLRLTSSEAYERYNIHPSAFYAAIRDLWERGLIYVTKRGKGAGNLYAIAQAPLIGLYRRYSRVEWRPG